VAASYCGWPFARVGGPVKTEEDPLDSDPPVSFRQTLLAIRHLEDAVMRANDLRALALRFGNFYGPGTSIGKDGFMLELVRKRSLPIVGDGAGVWSFIHVQDVALATAAAIERGAPGLYNVVDDDPAPVSEWLPALARAVGAKPPCASRPGSPALAGRRRRGAHDEGARRLQCQGAARPGVAARLPDVAPRLRGRARAAARAARGRQRRRVAGRLGGLTARSVDSAVRMSSRCR
jgi:nucleoside-diphosphate-sugar epimerase